MGENKKESQPGKIVIGVIMALALLLITIALISFKFQLNRIKKLEEENKRLSEPTVQYEVATTKVSIEVIKSDIQDIGELATIEYLYTDAGKFEDSAKLFGKEIPFFLTTKSFILKWDGSIKAGVDVEKIITEVNDSTKEIVVHIPKAKIFSHEIDDESIEVLDEKNGLFNQIKVRDIKELNINSKDKMEKRVIENGLLDKAFENAQKMIYKLINTDIVQQAEYKITFKTIE